MNRKDHTSILEENLKALEESLKWLIRSYNICNNEFDINNLSDDGMDAFESFTSRFARTADLLFNKVFRGIAYLEEGEQLPWIDVIMVMEKAGVIDSSEDIRLIKELRNDVVHEYVMKDLIPLFGEILLQCPKLIEYSGNATAKSEELIKKIRRKK